MAHDVADRGLSVFIFALNGQLEVRKVPLDRIVPSHLSIVDEHSDQRRGKRFRRRTDKEARFCRRGCFGLDFRESKPARKDDFVPHHDRYRATGHMVFNPAPLDLF